VKRALLLGGLAGLGVVLVLVARLGVSAVAAAVGSIGWRGFAAFTAYWLMVMAVLGAAWFMSAPGAGAARFGAFVWGRLLREAASDVLPLSQLGGLVLGPRAVIGAGVPEALAFASLLVDLAAEIAAQIIYTLLGMALFALAMSGRAEGDGLWLALGGAGLMLAAVVGMLLGQRRLLAGLGRLARRWTPDAARRADGVILELDRIYARPARLTAAVALHLAGWVGGSVASWMALRFMGAPAPLWAVIALESLMYAARNLGFAFPGGLGIQEAAYALLGPACGIPAEQALALSFLRRARDLVIGLPVLAVWQAREGRVLLRRRSPKSSP
jgi:putative membrane protein